MTISTHSNHYLYQKQEKAISLSSDDLRIILMNPSFSFNRDSHSTLEDVTSYQIVTNYGYIQNNKALEVSSHLQDNARDRAIITYANVVWIAVGGAIGPFGSVIIYDNTVVDKTIIGCIDFENYPIGGYTILNGKSFQILAITFIDE